MKFSDVESDAKKYGISVQGYNNAHNKVIMYKDAAEELNKRIDYMDGYIDLIGDCMNRDNKMNLDF